MPNSFPILVNSGGASRTTAKLMKTGQITSYRTGDDGDIEAGREVDFFTLAENNPFGNTNRFTDELGGQIYTNNIVIDWSTWNGLNVLGWYRTKQAEATWDDAIDGCLLLNVAGFTTWYLPNVAEMFSLICFGTLPALNYTPFNDSSPDILWTSTTRLGSPTAAMHVRNKTYYIADSLKTTSLKYYVCREFTLIGTTLT